MSEAPLAEAMSAGSGGEARGPVSYKWLVAILLVAFILRLGFMLYFTPVISGDGCEYIRMGMELRDGKPLTGVFEWPETMYGTLYPVLIAGVSRLGLSAEHSAELLSLLFGTALVLVAFFVARLVYGTRTGYLAAILFSIFPLYIGLSGSVYNETIYMTLWLAGIFSSLRVLDSFRLPDFLFAGVFFGLATLSRPEAFAYPLFIIAAVTIVAALRRIALRKALRGALLLFSAWFVLMVPYAAFLHAHTGQYRFEGKWNINYTLGQRINSGMSYFQAGLGIDDKLHLVGPLLDSSIYAAYTPYPHELRDKLRYMGSTFHRNWPNTYEEMFTIDFGGPVVVLLVVLGLFGAAWNRERLRHEAVLIAMALSIVVLMATAANLEHRYSFPLSVIYLLWAALGLDVFREWTISTLGSLGARIRLLAQSTGQIAVVALCFMLVAFSFVGVRTARYIKMQQKGYLGIRQAGLWLRAQAPTSPRILGFEGRVAYYADGTNIIFPYTDSVTALRYLETKNIDYIVLDSEGDRVLPAMGQWHTSGVPDPRAHLVFKSSEGGDDQIEIYSWDKPGKLSSLPVSQAAKE